jgi:hypothetical protein
VGWFFSRQIQKDRNARRRISMSLRNVQSLIIAVGLAFFAVACGRKGTLDSEKVASRGDNLTLAPAAPNLQLRAETPVCKTRQVQDKFKITNEGTTSVKLSDITIKLWIEDTSGTTIAPRVVCGGCQARPDDDDDDDDDDNLSASASMSMMSISSGLDGIGGDSASVGIIESADGSDDDGAGLGVVETPDGIDDDSASVGLMASATMSISSGVDGIAGNSASGGIVESASSSDGECFRDVWSVKVGASSFATACGTDANHQANWEITVSTKDTHLLAPGQSWKDLKILIPNCNGFSPGTSFWYSSCLAKKPFKADAHYAIYVGGNLVRTSPGVPPSCRAPHGTQPLTGEVIPGLESYPLVGPVPGDTQVTVGIGLPLRNKADLQTLIDQVTDPTSPQYRQYLTPDAFAAAFGPTAADYQSVQDFATAAGLTVSSTYTSRDMLLVTGPASAIENAFFTTLNIYKRTDSTTFFAAANDPSVNLTTSLLHVTGFDSFAVPVAAGATNTTACPGFNAFFGPDFRTTYANGFDPNEGQGQTIALFEPDTYKSANITTYANGGGSPALGSPIATHAPSGNLSTLLASNVHQVVIPCSGACTALGFAASPGFSPSVGEPEVEVGMETALAMAPQAKVVVYEQNPATVFNYLPILQQMAENVPGTGRPPEIIANSWIWLQGTSDPNETQVFLQYALQGQTFLQASGDLGAYNIAGAAVVNVPDPIMESSLMTVVGGTQFDSSFIPVESAWNDFTERTSVCVPPILLTNPPIGPTNCYSATGGGSCNAYAGHAALPVPNYQTGLGGTARMIPDVSIVANHLATFTSTSGGTGVVSCSHGTSASAALWAGVIALSNDANTNYQAPIGFANPKLYSLATTQFHDITVGDNNYGCTTASCTGASYQAVAGYDMATGLGSPLSTLLPQLPPQACASGSSLSAITLGTSVTAYVPRGSYSEKAYGVDVVPVEVAPGGSLPPPSGTPLTLGGTDINEPNNVINTCASIATTLPPQIVCTSNGRSVYVINANSNAVTPLTDNADTGAFEQMSGGTCQTCNVVVDPIGHKAYLSIATGTDSGSMSTGAAYQSLDLTNPTGAGAFGTPIQLNQEASTEDAAFDPIRHLILTPNEGFFETAGVPGDFQLVDTSVSTNNVLNFTPSGGPPGLGGLDAAAEDCQTGIAIVTDEFTNGIYLADLTQMTKNPVAHTWTPNAGAAQFVLIPEFQGLTGTVDEAGTSTVAFASGSHMGVVAGEFGGGTFAAIQLPGSSGPDVGTPQLVDYVIATIPPTPTDSLPWSFGADPHTLTAYVSPNSKKPYAIFEDDIHILTSTPDGQRTCLAVVDLEALMNRPRGTAPTFTMGGPPDTHQLATELTTVPGGAGGDTCIAPNPVTGVNPAGCIVRYICGMP